MQIIKHTIEGLISIHPSIYGDERGYFFESFNENKYSEYLGSELKLVQDNISISKVNVLRGLHFQLPPYSQGKLVSVVKGRVLDVAVDLRKNSPSYGKHICVELSQANGLQFYIPPGFAHGFQALEDDTIFTYKCTDYYSATDELTIRWNDPQLAIEWPITPAMTSPKDDLGLFFNEINSPF